MKDFVHPSLLVEQDRMHSYHAGVAYWLPVLLMNWTGNSLVPRGDRRPVLIIRTSQELRKARSPRIITMMITPHDHR